MDIPKVETDQKFLYVCMQTGTIGLDETELS